MPGSEVMKEKVVMLTSGYQFIGWLADKSVRPKFIASVMLLIQLRICNQSSVLDEKGVSNQESEKSSIPLPSMPPEMYLLILEWSGLRFHPFAPSFKDHKELRFSQEKSLWLALCSQSFSKEEKEEKEAVKLSLGKENDCLTYAIQFREDRIRLTGVSVPDTVNEGLLRFVIPKGVAVIDPFAFSSLERYKEYCVYSGFGPEDTLSVFGLELKPGEDPMEFTDETWLSKIGLGSFLRDNRNSEIIKTYTVVLPDSLTEIGVGAFFGCSGLIQITIPAGVTEIGKSAFGGCWSLTQMIIPDGVTTIGQSAFRGCSGLTELVIPEGVTEIGEGAFYGCSSLTEFVIPASVTEIGEYAFYGCSGLTTAAIPDGVTEIGDNAFEDCSSLTSVVIPESVTTIGQSVFEECSGLTELTIPESVTTIELCAFHGCSSLTSVAIPASVTEIGVGAFAGCSGLTSVVIPESVTTIGQSAFRGCSGLTELIIPAGVTEIGVGAFEDCSSLTSLTVPDDLYDHVSANRDSYGLSEKVDVSCPGLQEVMASLMPGC